ncbi:TPA: hypothetical protein ACH3X2_009553 [Trebouxia sp. C0005]
MSKLDAVPENHSYEAVLEQQQQDVFDDGSPRRLPHPVPVRGASFSAKPIRRQLSIDSQMSASVRKMTPSELPTSRVKQSHVWGWLDPSSNTDLMPVTYLKGAGAAIGRDIEAFEAKQGEQGTETAPAGGSPLQAGRGGDHLPKMSFVEVSDTRVSRLHCVIKLAAPTDSSSSPQAMLEDHSSNGTYVDDVRVKQGEPMVLTSGSKVSLVRSVTPWVERCFTFWEGDPRDSRSGIGSETGEVAAFASEAAKAAAASGSPRRRLERTATSDYTTAESSTLDDFQCQICLGTLRDCVALEPCGHNWCATCLSHHFASLLQSGVPLACPLRCVPPDRIVSNRAVRSLVDELSPPPAEQPARSSSTALARTVSRRASLDLADGEMEVMSAICPLGDDYLPIDAGSLKSKQLEVCMRQIEDSASEALTVLQALESLARLAWNDDDVREQVAQMDGIEVVSKVMDSWQKHEGVQCNCCLAIMALVRGTGSVCQANQFRVAEARGVEAVVAAMTRFSSQTTVQLSALLCFIPLALENIMMQAHVSQLALKCVLAALAQHPDDVDIQAKGLVVLGVLGQGEDVVHDAIRQQQLDAGVPALIAAALAKYKGQNEEVLWAALFSLAVLIREGGDPYIASTDASVEAGLLPLLQAALKDYEARVGGNNDDADMIQTAGKYLIETLTVAAYVYKIEAALGIGAITIAISVAVVIVGYLWRRR